ncbi:hypothetical protein OEZ86_009840 [Tetradesmus obliquus]|uniref:RNA helicase n=1 Tax=Tetradesmus obliquus TaxID=3088 RepID=A0ABY8UMX7_TETOB|nr:hypothetical protein OEZ85_001278 [Tetradesmus obliquus]WIA43349.1 hypothetical protein OEZ86_009840 [Tetradesmus obliquus]
MGRSPSPGRDRKRSYADEDRSERGSKRAREDDRREDTRDRYAEDGRRDRERGRSDHDSRNKDSRDRARDLDRGRERDERRRERSRSRSRDRRRRSRSIDRSRDREPARERERDRGLGYADRQRDRERRRDSSSDRPPRASGGSRQQQQQQAEDEEGEQQQRPSSGDAGAANGKAAKAEPLSLEELLKKKKEEQELAAKPKFLSKAERQALALQRRQEEAAELRTAQDEMRRLQAAQQQDEMRRAEAMRREAERNRHRDEREKEKELELIRKQYLGDDKFKKKKVVKASEKFRFNFDWDGKEDTSKDLNPLYNHLHQANLLFGRGMLAGIDRREQKKVAATVEADMLKKLRGAAGIVETSDMRAAAREREARADKYDGFDMTTDVHWSEKPLNKMSERDWRIFREDFNISYKGNANTLPLRNWDEAGLPEPIRMAVDFVQYDKPSPIQMASIPLGLKQLDVIGVAETGSGKTAAFVIPMLCYIMRQPVMDESNYADGPYAVVLAPTRELAQQIEEETVKLAKYTDFKVTSVVGGQSIEEQGSKLRRGCEIVIATPGRLLDCIERHYCVLNQCNYVVLDEADRMIDLGFEPQVQAVLDAMPHATLKPEDENTELDQKRTYRTTYMFSATMPPAVERLARKYLRRPIVVNIGRAGMAGENVTQRVIMIKENEKAHRLSSELDMIHEKKVIVFVNTKRQCDNVYAHLEDAGYHCTVLHGGRTQDQREDQREISIKGFKEDTYNVLIATDVAGRGIDVPDVALVINYDMPNNIEAYTHRIGRTGRAGRKGTAITFLTGGDSEVFYDLKRLLEESKAVVPPELARSEAAKQKPGGVSQKRDSIQYAKK